MTRISYSLFFVLNGLSDRFAVFKYPNETRLLGWQTSDRMKKKLDLLYDATTKTINPVMLDIQKIKKPPYDCINKPRMLTYCKPMSHILNETVQGDRFHWQPVFFGELVRDLCYAFFPYDYVYI